MSQDTTGMETSASGYHPALEPLMPLLVLPHTLSVDLIQFVQLTITGILLQPCVSKEFRKHHPPLVDQTIFGMVLAAQAQEDTTIVIRDPIGQDRTAEHCR